MKISYPGLRRIAKGVGIYRPLHSWWIGHLVRRLGCTVRYFSSSLYELEKDGRVIRYDNWRMAFVIAQQFDHFFDAVESADIQGKPLVDYSHGAWQRLSKSKSLFYFHSLAEPEETTDVYASAEALQPGAVVFDLGAYNGTQTIRFSEMVGSSGRVFAFEPDPKSRDALTRNIAYHQANNVVIESRGIWSHSGQLGFWGDGTMMSTFVMDDSHVSQKNTLPVVSLSDFASEKNLTHVHFIKMDIEGAELEVVLKATNFFLKYRPQMVIEAHFMHEWDMLPPVCRHLESIGYKCDLVNQGSAVVPLIMARFYG